MATTSRRVFLLQSGSTVALGIALNACVPNVEQMVGNDIRWLSTNITGIVNEIKKIFPHAINAQISAVINDLVSISQDLYQISNTIWPAENSTPSNPSSRQLQKIGQDVYSFIDILDKLADIASQVTSNPVVAGITIALGAILVVLKTLGITPPPPAPVAAPAPPGMVMLSRAIPPQGHFFRRGAERYADSLSTEQARQTLRSPPQ